METYDAHKTTTEVRQAQPHARQFLGADHFDGVAIVALFAIIFLVFFVNTPPTAISP